MPLSLRRGRVTAVVERVEGLARLEVDGVACVAYPELTGPVALDDDVIVNVQARELELGSGGFDVLHVNLTRGLGLPAELSGERRALLRVSDGVLQRRVRQLHHVGIRLDGQLEAPRQVRVKHVEPT